MPMERESKLQERCMKIAREYGVYVYKNAQSMYTEVGRPDLSLCVPCKLSTLARLFGEDCVVGVFMGLELKRKGHLNEVSEAQQIVGRKIQNAGGLWYLVDDSEKVKDLMEKLVNGTSD